MNASDTIARPYVTSVVEQPSLQTEGFDPNDHIRVLKEAYRITCGYRDWETVFHEKQFEQLPRNILVSSYGVKASVRNNWGFFICQFLDLSMSK